VLISKKDNIAIGPTKNSLGQILKLHAHGNHSSIAAAFELTMAKRKVAALEKVEADLLVK
jgi:hypothetical protein